LQLAGRTKSAGLQERKGRKARTEAVQVHTGMASKGERQRDDGREHMSSPSAPPNNRPPCSVEINNGQRRDSQHKSVTIPRVLGTKITHDVQAKRQVAAVRAQEMIHSLGQQQRKQRVLFLLAWLA
jgi:hypothetical protein